MKDVVLAAVEDGCAGVVHPVALGKVVEAGTKEIVEREVSYLGAARSDPRAEDLLSVRAAVVPARDDRTERREERWTSGDLGEMVSEGCRFC